MTSIDEGLVGNKLYILFMESQKQLELGRRRDFLKPIKRHSIAIANKIYVKIV